MVKHVSVETYNLIDRVIDILKSHPQGATKENILNDYYSGALPDSNTQQKSWERIKYAIEVCNSFFNLKHEGYCWIRARRDVLNTFYYHIVAEVVNEEVVIRIDEFHASQLDGQHDREWKTRTKTKMRSAVAAAMKLLERGQIAGSQQIIGEAEEKLSELTIVSARLASINFGSGIVKDDLLRLSQSPKLGLLHPQIKRALKGIARAGEAIDELASTVMGLARIAQKGIKKELTK